MGRRGSSRRLRARSRRALAAQPAQAALGTAAAACSLRPCAPLGSGTAPAGRRGGEGTGGGKGRAARSCGGRGGRALPGGPALEWTPGFANGLSGARSGSSAAPAARAAPRARLLRGAEVDRGRCRWLAGGLAGAPRATRPRSRTAAPSPTPPAAPGHPPGPRASCDPWHFGTGSAGWAGADGGHCSVAGGRKRVSAPPSRPPRKSRFAPLPAAARKRSESSSAAKAQEARALESLRAPHFGVSCPVPRSASRALPALSERSCGCLHRGANPREPLAVVLAPAQV